MRALVEFQGKQGDVINVGQLREHYLKLCAEVFAFSPEELLYNLLEIFDNLFPDEADHLRQFSVQYEFYNGLSNLLLRGEIQSGKTAMMVLTTLCYLSCGRDVVVVVRNKVDDKVQFINRFNSIVNELKQKASHSDGRFVAVGGSDPIPDHPCVFVEIFLKGNLSRLYSKIRGRNLRNAVLYIDEADLRDDYKHPLFTSVGKTIYVSATVQDIIVADWKIKTKSVLSLAPPITYKGVQHLQIIERDLHDSFEFFYALCVIAADNEHLSVSPEHPKIVLINIDKTLNKIDEIFAEFKHTRHHRTPYLWLFLLQI